MNLVTNFKAVIRGSFNMNNLINVFGGKIEAITVYKNAQELYKIM